MTDSKAIILRGQEQADYAIKLVSTLPKDKDKPLWTVRFEPYEKERTRQQNAYNWKINDHLSQHAFIEREEVSEHGEVYKTRRSMSKEGWHYYDALRFLDPIVIFDPITREERLMPASTSNLGVKRFAEFLTKRIHYWEVERGILLPNPTELVWGK